MDTVVFVDPKVIDFFGKEMILVQLNGDAVDTALARQYCVSGYPTLVLMDKDGKEVDRVAGYMPPDDFIKTFRDYKNGVGTLADLLKQASAKTDRDLFMQIAEKYKYGCDKGGATQWYTKVISAGDPKDSLSAQSRMELADMLARASKYDSAVVAYQAIASDFAGKSTASDADWTIGNVYRRAKDTAKAIAAFEAWMTKYPAAHTSDVNYTKKMIDRLKNPPPPKSDATKK